MTTTEGGWHRGAVVSTIASQQDGSGFKPTSCVWSLHVLLVPAWVLFGFLPQIENMHLRLIGQSKLPVGVNVCVNDCLSTLC